jgi:hypothetical protein
LNICGLPDIFPGKIFLSVCVVSVARVAPEDRYIVNKARSLEGLYGVTYYIGFREEFDVKVRSMLRQEKFALTVTFLQPTAGE